MTDRRLGKLPVGEIVRLISSDAITPGAGAAGAVALALASACAAKAVSISLKHSSNECLAKALPRLERLCALALHDADIDSIAFRAFIRGKSAKTASNLVETGESLGRQIGDLLSIVSEAEPYIASSMQGDLVAAKALAAAAQTIQSTDEEEAKDERREITERSR